MTNQLLHSKLISFNTKTNRRVRLTIKLNDTSILHSSLRYCKLRKCIVEDCTGCFIHKGRLDRLMCAEKFLYDLKYRNAKTNKQIHYLFGGFRKAKTNFDKGGDTMNIKQMATNVILETMQSFTDLEFVHYIQSGLLSVDYAKVPIIASYVKQRAKQISEWLGVEVLPPEFKEE